MQVAPWGTMPRLQDLKRAICIDCFAPLATEDDIHNFDECSCEDCRVLCWRIFFDDLCQREPHPRRRGRRGW